MPLRYTGVILGEVPPFLRLTRKGGSGMALTTARKKANAKYEAKAYDKTLIRLPKGRLDEIRAHIEPTGESLNGFINRAILEAMERDKQGSR